MHLNCQYSHDSVNDNLICYSLTVECYIRIVYNEYMVVGARCLDIRSKHMYLEGKRSALPVKNSV